MSTKTHGPGDDPSIAYLTGYYPAVSHTFILREIEALGDQGLDIRPCAIRRADPKTLLGRAERREAARTFYVLRAACNPLTLITAQGTALREPGRYLRTLALALRLRAPGLRALLYQLIYFAEATVLARQLRKDGVSHLHNHFASASATVAMLAARLADIDFSFTLHGPSDLFEATHWRLDAKVAEARFVACISHFARSQAMYHSAPEHWEKLKIVHCGVEPELYGSTDGGTDRDSGLHMVFIGRLAPVKGLRVLIAAFAEALSQEPGLRLTIVGDGEDRTTLEALAAPLGNAIRFTGYLSQQEVTALLARADALVLPSFAEGVPVVLMEAMASGKPVIATQVAGVAELVENGVSGYLVPPGDATALADRILRLAADPEARRAMGRAGRAYVEREFDIRREAVWLASLFRGMEDEGIRPSGS
ncbi:glycosyltransferase [Rhodovulum steppense]|uniref:Glycosyltransferase involved in cell wall biosynthesis n=1 Tax=Rhodovulum steppense TaxID=540251 RepID=A0A4R1YN15_9RHOB|nr:glycosyltransferase [Rhodovulum steppense]TCM78971.1 glycosyltransferase involved in cell wall biosynthesis [Rhodovulum steppense]